MKKQMTAVMMMLAMAATPVLAQNPAQGAFETRVFHTEAGNPMQLAELSAQEMKETEGAALWFVPALGAAAATGFRFAVTGFTRHASHQVIARNGVGVSNRAILNTLRNPQQGSLSTISGRNAGTTKYIGNNASVVVNRNGQVVSAWARNSNGHRIK